MNKNFHSLLLNWSLLICLQLVLLLFLASEEDEKIPSLLSKEPAVKGNWDDEDVDENDVKDSWEDDDEPAPPVRLIT